MLAVMSVIALLLGALGFAGAVIFDRVTAALRARPLARLLVAGVAGASALALLAGGLGCFVVWGAR